MIAIICDEDLADIGEKIVALIANRTETTYLVAKRDEIKPCLGCAGCLLKTYQKCVFRDEMDKILPALAIADIWMMITPVLWGGPSYTIKKVIDKSALLGNPFYKIKKGELVKGAIVPVKKLAMIGATDKCNDKEKDDFIFWSREVAKIMNIESFSQIVSIDEKEDDLRVVIDKLIK